jgi:hypothetical protein
MPWRSVILAALVLLDAGCARASAATSNSRRTPRVGRFCMVAHRLVPMCKPRAARLELQGFVRVRSMGKGLTGVVLEADAGDWIMSYRAAGLSRHPGRGHP